MLNRQTRGSGETLRQPQNDRHCRVSAVTKIPDRAFPSRVRSIQAAGQEWSGRKDQTAIHVSLDAAEQHEDQQNHQHNPNPPLGP